MGKIIIPPDSRGCCWEKRPPQTALEHDCRNHQIARASPAAELPLILPGPSTLPCPSIILPHYPPSSRSLNSYIIQQISRPYSKKKFYLYPISRSFQHRSSSYKDNRCTPHIVQPPYHFLRRRSNNIPLSATSYQHSKLNAAHGTLSTG